MFKEYIDWISGLFRSLGVSEDVSFNPLLSEAIIPLSAILCRISGLSGAHLLN